MPRIMRQRGGDSAARKEIGGIMADEKARKDGVEPEAGRELADEQLGEVAGGTLGGPTCPSCGGTNLKYVGANVTVCEDCGYGG